MSTTRGFVGATGCARSGIKVTTRLGEARQHEVGEVLTVATQEIK